MKSITKFKSIFILALASFISLTGCQIPGTNDIAPESDHQEITVTTGAKINGKLALEVNIVQAYDKKMFQELQKMDATEFRNKKDQIALSNPDGISVWTFDFISRQSKSYKLPSNKNYWGTIIYLHFIDNLDNKLVIPSDMKHVQIHIEESRFSIKKDFSMHSYKDLEVGGN